MIWLLAQNIGRVLAWISHWCRSISYLSSLLDKDDRLIRIAAGEALALIFEMGYLEKFSIATTGLSDSSNHNRIKARELAHIQGLRAKILNQVKSLSMEAGGKGSVKKDLNFQRNTFRDILEYLEVIHSLHVVSLFFFFWTDVSICGLIDQDGYSPETSMKIGRVSFSTITWSQLIQVYLCFLIKVFWYFCQIFFFWPHFCLRWIAQFSEAFSWKWICQADAGHFL